MPDNSVYKDSLSSCSSYDNPYASRYANHPELEKQQIPTKSTEEAANPILTRDTLERFLSQNFRMDEQKIWIITKSGKMVLLIFIGPIFFFFLKMPKWVFLNSAPLVKHLQKLLTSLGQRFDKLQKKLVQLIQQTAISIKQRLKALIAHTIVKPLERLRQIIARPFVVAGQMIKGAIEQGKRIAQFSKKLGQLVSRTISQTIERLEKGGRLLGQKISQVGKELVASLFSPWKRAADIVNNRINNFRSALYQLTDFAKQMTSHFAASTKWGRNTLKKGMERGRERLRDAFESGVELAKKIINKTIEIGRIDWNPLKERIEKQYESLRQNYESLRQNIAKMSENCQQLMHQAVQFMNQAFLHPTLALLTPLVQRITDMGSRKGRQLTHVINQMSHRFKRAAVFVKQLTKRSISLIGPLLYRCLLWVSRKLAQWIQTLLEKIISFFALLVNGFIQTCRFIRLVYLSLKLLFQYTISSLNK